MPQNKKIRWSLLRLLPYNRPYYFMLAVGLSATVFAYVAEALPPLVFGWIIDEALVDGDWERLLLLSSYIGLAFLFYSFFDYLGVLWMESWGMKIEHDVRVDAFDRAQRLDMTFFDQNQSGRVLSILSHDINQLEQFLDTNIQNLLQAAIQMLTMTIIMFGLNWQLTLILILPLPIMAYATIRYTGEIKGAYRKISRTVGEINAKLADILSNIAIVKAFAREPLERRRLAAVSRTYHDANIRAITLRAVFFPALNLISYVAYVTILVIGGYMVLQGNFTIGALATFLMYTQRFYQPLSRFGRTVNDFQRAEASCERIFTLMDHEQVEENWEAPAEAEEQLLIRGSIRLENVSLTYATGDTPALEHVSFSVPPESSLGVVGPTGSGKSTLTKLLLHFYRPTEGQIFIDERPISDYPLQTLREAIGVVAQDTEMFFGSLWENVVYGDPEAAEDQVWQAIETAGVTEFLDRLPKGVHTLIGERGVKLSGGQRQRVAIARALLKDPQILILDEATSAVDSTTERQIQAALNELSRRRTTVAIAHRLSTIQDCDQIIVFDRGRIVERGTHRALLDANGLYAELWWAQQHEESESEVS